MKQRPASLERQGYKQCERTPKMRQVGPPPSRDSEPERNSFDSTRESDEEISIGGSVHSDETSGDQLQSRTQQRNHQRTQESVDESEIFDPTGVPDDDSSNDDMHRCEGVLHEHLKQSAWKEILACLHELREQGPGSMARALSALDENDATPIHTAVWKAPLPLTKLLISVIPYPSRESMLLLQDIDGNTPLHLACANLELKDSDGNFDASVISILEKASPGAHEVKNWQGDTPLHLLLSSPAFRTEKLNFKLESAADELFRSLWVLGSKISKAQNSTGATPLHVAVAHGAHTRVLMTLLELAPEAANIADKSGMLPLHYVAACINSIPEATFASKVVEANPGAIIHQCSTGDTPLHLFVSNARGNISKAHREVRNTTKLADVLLGSSDIQSMCPLLIRNRDSLSPLHCCALFNCPSSITRILIVSPFASSALSLVDTNKATPLHLACASSSVEDSIKQVEVLGMANASAKKAALRRDCRDRTPMHIAAENPKAQKYLIKVLAEINPKAAKREATSRKLMPLHVAIRCRADEAVIRTLLRVYPAAVKVVFEGGNTVLHEACKYTAPLSCVRALIKAYPTAAKIQNKFGNLPLHFATAYHVQVDVMELILDAFPGAAMVKNLNDDLPVHYAASHPESIDSTKLLVQIAPQSANIANRGGDTPLDCAERSSLQQDVLNFLKKKA